MSRKMGRPVGSGAFQELLSSALHFRLACKLGLERWACWKTKQATSSKKDANSDAQQGGKFENVGNFQSTATMLFLCSWQSVFHIVKLVGGPWNVTRNLLQGSPLLHELSKICFTPSN